MGLYRSLTLTPGNRGVNEAPALCGFELGNRSVTGCLSNDESSRVHSCEPGVSCSAARGAETVSIVPIVNRTSGGAEIPEVGAGGGIGDLYQTHELELPNESALAELEKLCLQHVHDETALCQIRTTLLQAFQSRKKALSLDTYGLKEEGEISLENLVTALSHGPSQASDESSNPDLPNTIVSIAILLLRMTYSNIPSASHIHDTPHIPNYVNSLRPSGLKISIHALSTRRHGTRMSRSDAYLATSVQKLGFPMTSICDRL